MLLTLFKALKVDFRNAENSRYERSETNTSQHLSRILSIRKHYPEFTNKGSTLFPKLAELSKLSKKEGLCLSYWHDSGEMSEFDAAVAKKPGAEKFLPRQGPRRKEALLNQYISQASDAILLKYLTEIAADHPPKGTREFGPQNNRLQVTSLLYHLHILDEQLKSMIARSKGRQIDFTPPPLVQINPVVQNSVDNGAPPATYSANSSKPKQTPKFDTTGPIDIWYGLAEDPRTPYRFLVWLSENHNPYISQRAMTTLKRQQLASQKAYAS